MQCALWEPLQEKLYSWGEVKESIFSEYKNEKKSAGKVKGYKCKGVGQSWGDVVGDCKFREESDHESMLY